MGDTAGGTKDLIEFWEKEVGPSYYNNFKKQTNNVYGISTEAKSRMKNQENKITELLQKYRFNKILELGCGFGRYTKILSDLFKPEKYVATDLIKEQIENAKKYVGNDKIDYRLSPIQDFNIEEKFDLVFASEFLVHINFVDIEHVIKKMVSFSSNKVIFLDMYDKKMFGKDVGGVSTKGIGTAFHHDYQTLFEKYGAKNFKAYPITFPFRTRLLMKCAKMLGKYGIAPQAIFVMDV